MMESSVCHRVLEQHSDEIQRDIQTELTWLVDKLVDEGVFCRRPQSLSEGLKFQNFSGEACPQTPQGGCGLWAQLINFPTHKRSLPRKNPV